MIIPEREQLGTSIWEEKLNVTNLRHLIKVTQNGTTPGDPVC